MQKLRNFFARYDRKDAMEELKKIGTGLILAGILGALIQSVSVLKCFAAMMSGLIFWVIGIKRADTEKSDAG